MSGYNYLRASDGTGNAVLAHITAEREIGATVLEVDSLDNWDDEFIVVTGELNAAGYLIPATMTEMIAHQDAGNIQIDGYAPGYTDTGNTTNQVAVIKPSTHWTNSMVENAQVAHEDDGKLKITALDRFYKPSEQVFDHVSSGAVWSGLGYGSNLNATMTAGVIYINGLRNTLEAVATRTFTASKDTYVDALYNASGVATLVYTEVANNAASPALAANSIRIGIVVSGAASIAAAASINQGQEDRVLPIASSMPYSVSDSLGNLICPRDPNRKILTVKQRRSAYTADTAESVVGIPGFSTPIKVPEGRKIRVTFQAPNVKTNNASVGYVTLSLHEGAAVAGTQLTFASNETAVVNKGSQMQIEHTFTPSSSNPTISVGFRTAYTGTIWGASAGSVSASCIQLTVELV